MATYLFASTSEAAPSLFQRGSQALGWAIAVVRALALSTPARRGLDCTPRPTSVLIPRIVLARAVAYAGEPFLELSHRFPVFPV